VVVALGKGMKVQAEGVMRRSMVVSDVVVL
jgi:hypothetical protein